MKNVSYSRFIEAVETSTIIPAVKDEESLEKCLNTESSVVFILFGDICNITGIVAKVKAHNKIAMVHLDLITGLGSKEVSVDYLKNVAKADGIITTKPQLAKHAKEQGMYSILRFFIIDSLALANLKRQTADSKPDCIEILPGVMPKVINSIVKETRTPLIAGGLISDKEDVCGALTAGAIAVSSTNKDVWTL